MKVTSSSLLVISVIGFAILAACPLPYQYNGPGASNSHTSDPSSPSVTAPVVVSYSVQGGASGTILDNGAFYSGQTTTVTLSTATVNAVIFYTDNGTDLSLTSLGSAKKISGSTGDMTISRATSLQCVDICAIAIGPNMLPSVCVNAIVGVSPYPILSIAVDKATVSEDAPNNKAKVTVTSSSPAPASGITVTLKTSDAYDAGHVSFPVATDTFFTATILPAATTTTLDVPGVHNGDTASQKITLTIQDDPSPATTYTVGAPRFASVLIQEGGTHTVTYDANGGVGAVPADGSFYQPGALVTVLGNIGGLVKTGCAFAGWTTNPNTTGTSASYAAGTKWTMGSGDVILYAVWIPSNLTFTSSGNAIAIIAYSTAPTGALVIPPGVTSIGGFYNCTGLTSVTIPSSVISVAGYAFQSCSGLASLTIFRGVTSIGVFAFAYTGLTSIALPASVTSIEGSAFAYCNQLTSILVDSVSSHYASSSGVLFDKAVTTLVQAPGALTGSYAIPPGVATIGWAAFGGCSRLTSVTIPSSVTSIGDSAFWNCSGLTSITIPSSVTSIQHGAFGGCSRLTSVTIPSSVTLIGGSPFSACAGLTSILVDSSNPNYTSSSGILFDKAQKTLIQAPGAMTGSYSIPSSVTTIGVAAFFQCGLTSIIIPSSVTGIGSSAFGSCPRLVSVSVQASTPPGLSASSFAFANEASGFAIHVPDAAAVATYQAARGWSDYASVIVTP